MEITVSINCPAINLYTCAQEVLYSFSNTSGYGSLDSASSVKENSPSRRYAFPRLLSAYSKVQYGSHNFACILTVRPEGENMCLLTIYTEYASPTTLAGGGPFIDFSAMFFDRFNMSLESNR